MTLEVELADGTVDTFSEDGEHADETYIHRIDGNEELVVLRVRNGADGPYAEHEVARYPKNTWRSIRESTN